MFYSLAAWSRMHCLLISRKRFQCQRLKCIDYCVLAVFATFEKDAIEKEKDIRKVPYGD